jgi:two-component system, OmpR family, osmolarity sensor histidine kinase EnvZ
MHLWPRSLLWRTFALLSLLGIATTIAWLTIFNTFEQAPRATQMAQTIASIVNLTRTALVTAQSELRRDLLLDLAEREGIEVYLAEEDDLIESPPDSPVSAMVTSQLREQLGPQTRIGLTRNGQAGFWVSFRIGGDEYWVRIPQERLEQRIALQWLVWAALAMVLALLAAYLIVSRISRPLKTLAEAAGKIGRGQSPGTVPEAGPAEIQAVARAFNQMSSDLDRMDRDRALILAGISHDLRTPLARLRLGTEMSGADDSLKEGMRADIEEMDRTIGQFLDFARESDGSGESPRPASVARIAQEIIEQQRRLGRAIETNIAPTPEQSLRVQAIRRVITNLIDNACKHGKEGIRVEVREQDGHTVIDVMDRGPGIPPGEVERMKQPFTQMDEARTGTLGSGLGLAIVERVVRQHGGRFDLLPREAGGLLARIQLPLLPV